MASEFINVFNIFMNEKDSMDNQKQTKADIVNFEFNPKYNNLKIAYGEAFYLHENTFWVSETPLQDPSLVPIENIRVVDGSLLFEAFYKKKNTHFQIAPLHKGSEILINYLTRINQKQLIIDQTFSQSIFIELDNKDVTLRLVDEAHNRRILITFSEQHGNHIMIRFPEPSRRFKVASCIVENTTLKVLCMGPDLSSKTTETSHEGLTYEWMLEFQTEIQEFILEYLKTISS